MTSRVIPDPKMLDQLACECQERTCLRSRCKACKNSTRANYYRQHDLFEEQWVEYNWTSSRSCIARYCKLGVAYYQIEHGNYRGALKMLQRSVQWLYICMPEVLAREST